MKFSKYISNKKDVFPENWSDHILPYKKLKKKLNTIKQDVDSEFKITSLPDSEPNSESAIISYQSIEEGNVPVLKICDENNVPLEAIIVDNRTIDFALNISA
ncbi:hypothetical protein AYI70_g10004 [Smittium culicis]|uniref:SPX domain-containing protein n=1 Tax=Smittium culicis TaxID=133412 RepID=A0A1R1X8M8_9FUNG|nr:hypothetical protein AYI70_g10004 [Smittium culicis]